MYVHWNNATAVFYLGNDEAKEEKMAMMKFKICFNHKYFFIFIAFYLWCWLSKYSMRY